MVTCQLCQQQFNQITPKHLTKEHGITYKQYKEQFPGAELISEEIRAKRKEGAAKSNLAERAVVRGKQQSQTLKQQYDANPKLCVQCNAPISYKTRFNQFCSQRCSGTHSNNNRSKDVYDKLSRHWNENFVGPKLTSTQRRRLKATIHNMCVVCNMEFQYHELRKTCSDTCYREYTSQLKIGKSGGHTKQQIPYIDSYGTECMLDSSWELKFANELDKAGVKWKRAERVFLSTGRRYTPDFYLSEYDVYVDPKAIRQGYSHQMEKIKQFEVEFNTRCFVITDYKLLTFSHIQTLLLLYGNKLNIR